MRSVALVVPFLQGDDPFALVADVHHDVVADDVGDPASDDLVDLEGLPFFGVHLIQDEVFSGDAVRQGGAQLVLQVLLGQIELAKQITIDHRK